MASAKKTSSSTTSFHYEFRETQASPEQRVIRVLAQFDNGIHCVHTAYPWVPMAPAFQNVATLNIFIRNAINISARLKSTEFTQVVGEWFAGFMPFKTRTTALRFLLNLKTSHKLKLAERAIKAAIPNALHLVYAYLPLLYVLWDVHELLDSDAHIPYRVGKIPTQDCRMKVYDSENGLFVCPVFKIKTTKPMEPEFPYYSYISQRHTFLLWQQWHLVLSTGVIHLYDYNRWLTVIGQFWYNFVLQPVPAVLLLKEKLLQRLDMGGSRLPEDLDEENEWLDFDLYAVYSPAVAVFLKKSEPLPPFMDFNPDFKELKQKMAPQPFAKCCQCDRNLSERSMYSVISMRKHGERLSSLSPFIAGVVICNTCSLSSPSTVPASLFSTDVKYAAFDVNPKAAESKIEASGVIREPETKEIGTEVEWINLHKLVQEFVDKRKLVAMFSVTGDRHILCTPHEYPDIPGSCRPWLRLSLTESPSFIWPPQFTILKTQFQKRWQKITASMLISHPNTVGISDSITSGNSGFVKMFVELWETFWFTGDDVVMDFIAMPKVTVVKSQLASQADLHFYPGVSELANVGDTSAVLLADFRRAIICSDFRTVIFCFMCHMGPLDEDRESGRSFLLCGMWKLPNVKSRMICTECMGLVRCGMAPPTLFAAIAKPFKPKPIITIESSPPRAESRAIINDVRAFLAPFVPEAKIEESKIEGSKIEESTKIKESKIKESPKKKKSKNDTSKKKKEAPKKNTAKIPLAALVAAPQLKSPLDVVSSLPVVEAAAWVSSLRESQIEESKIEESQIPFPTVTPLPLVTPLRLAIPETEFKEELAIPFVSSIVVPTVTVVATPIAAASVDAAVDEMQYQEDLMQHAVQTQKLLNKSKAKQTPQATNGSKSENVIIPEGEVCVICLEAARSMAFVPCGHFCVCNRCSKNPALNSSCPICRTKCTGFMRIWH